MSIVTTPTSLGSDVTRVGRPGVPPQPDEPSELNKATQLPVQITRTESPRYPDLNQNRRK
jgi:hypothetical protein